MLNSLDLPGRPEDTRIVVAMSGGVDSSVVAGILARQGYDVVGMTLQLYNHGEAVHRKGACCAGQDIHDARRVAETLGIPHYVLDYEEKFRKAVIDPFAQSYVDGETPIPCVSCNQTVKFADLADDGEETLARRASGDRVIILSVAMAGARCRRDPARAIVSALPMHGQVTRAISCLRRRRSRSIILRFPLGDVPKSADAARLAASYGSG